MNRLRFITALFGSAALAKGQQWKECEPEKGWTGGGILCSSKNKPAKNNQCPVCGEMAKPIKLADISLPCGVFRRPDGHLESVQGIASCPPAVGTPNLIRCSRCNAAFWQDAEK